MAIKQSADVGAILEFSTTSISMLLRAVPVNQKVDVVEDANA